MKRTYELGLDDNQIIIEVKVSTPALAQSIAKLSSSGGNHTIVAKSNVQNGNISSKNIGNAGTLRQKYLMIVTMIDCGLLDEGTWPSVLNTLYINYQISGGYSATQNYNADTDDIHTSPDGRLITITKPIKLI